MIYFKHHWCFKHHILRYMCVHMRASVAIYTWNVYYAHYVTSHWNLIKTKPYQRVVCVLDSFIFLLGVVQTAHLRALRRRCLCWFKLNPNLADLLLNGIFVRVFNPNNIARARAECWNDGNSDYYLLLTYKLTLNVANFVKWKKKSSKKCMCFFLLFWLIP